MLLVLALPLTAGGTYAPLWFALILTTVPTVVDTLQLALSRSREYDADLEAATLTGDPEWLASALDQLERSEDAWERVMVPRRQAPDPLLLRTHPPTAERIRRLRELVPRADRRQLETTNGPARRIPRGAVPVRLRFPESGGDPEVDQLEGGDR